MKAGDKVLPIGYTKNDLGVGTVDEIIDGIAYVYWPNIKHVGAWPIDQLEIVEGR